MYWVQFYHKLYDGSIAESVGFDSVYILDGRNSLWTMKVNSEKRMKQLSCHSFIGYRIFRGDHFYENNPLTPIILVD